MQLLNSLRAATARFLPSMRTLHSLGSQSGQALRDLAPTWDFVSSRCIHHRRHRAAVIPCAATALCSHTQPLFQSVWTSPVHTQPIARKAGNKRIRRTPRLQPIAATTHSFFAPEDTTFAGLGLEQDIVDALQRAGFTQPSQIQADSADVLQEGRNTVIAAETGSGKTLAYVAPLASMLLRLKRKLANTDKPWQYHALVLCPNQALCQQVISVVHSLKDESGEPLVTAAFVNSSSPPPFKNPDFILATPAGLLSFLAGAGYAYGALWTEDGLQGRVKHVVLDEADLMLTQAYSKPLKQVLELLRSGDRRRVEAKVFEELNIDEGVFDRLPRQLQVAAWSGGTRGLLDAGFRAKTPPAPDAQLGPYWRRQYVFVAATLPAITREDVGSQIERYYPDATWVSSSALHTSKAAVSHAWIKVDDSTWREALRSAITSDPEYQSGRAKVLVFTKDVNSVQHVSQELGNMDIRHVVYHKNLPLDTQRQALATMQHEACCVMVCTDAAARGLDIQDVSHVVQSDFAPNTIDFIHRIGRTARATRGGKVTSLYREHNVPLVEVLQSYVSEGRPLEAAFSRARSFSKKLDRRGMFVPRGMKKTEYLEAQGKDAAGQQQTVGNK